MISILDLESLFCAAVPIVFQLRHFCGSPFVVRSRIMQKLRFVFCFERLDSVKPFVYY